jgi:predicted ATPase
MTGEPRLGLALLGPPVLSRQGQPAAGLTLQKARALLIYLAMERGRDHSRETLVGLLWPEQPEAASRSNLRQALSTLREAIDDESARPPNLVVQRETIRFELSESDWLDVAQFSSLLDACQAHRHRHPDRCRACAWRREKAVALYRGEFLSGFHLRGAGAFDEWAAIQRERLHRRMVDAVGRLAVFYEASGDLNRAGHMIARQLELDPWMEEAHRERIRLLAVSGKRSEALAQFEACKKVLSQELGVDPSDETVSLVEQVRAGSLAGGARRSQADPDARVPRIASRLVGRETELADLAELLEDPDHRLVTITGAGGVGKTHLAMAAAREVAISFPGGVFFVPLTALDSSDQLPGAILTALEVGVDPSADPVGRLRESLRGRECLLVLDGIEHLLPAAREVVAALVGEAAGTTLLVTSQERLGLQAEWRYELAGLAMPAPGDREAARESPAVQLFLERGRQVGRRAEAEAEDLADVVRICRVVEGVPLAIELAASAVDVRPVGEIARALEQDVRNLETRHFDVPPRHRSQAAAFDYSWGLLEPRSQDDLRRLSVFRGGWDESAAVRVAGTTAQRLELLTDKSLIRRDAAGRYGFHPLLRRYAGERLRREGAEHSARLAHLQYFMDLASTAADHLAGDAQVVWLALLDQELANFRAALGWAQGASQAGLAAAVCLSLSRFWMIRGHLKEGQDWIEQVLQADPPPAPEVRVRLLNRAGILAAMQRRYDQAEAHLTASVVLSRELDDRLGEVTSLNSLGAMAIERRQYHRARQHLEACLPVWDDLGNTNGLASSLNNLGVVALMSGEPEVARGRFEEALLLFRQLGDRRMIAGVLHNLGDLQVRAGRPEAARTSFRESLELRTEIGEVGAVAESLEGLASVAVETGRVGEAARLYGAAAALRQAVGAPIAPVNQADYDRFVGRARSLIGEPAFVDAWSKGQALDAGQATALALSI